MGGGYIGVCTEINIQQGCLRPLKEDGLARLIRLIGQHGYIRQVGQQPLAVFGVLRNHCIQVDGLAPVHLGNDFVFQRPGASCLLCKHLRMGEIIHPDAAALILVHVSGTDAPLGGTNVGIAPELFAQPIQHNVPGHHHVGTGVNFQIIRGNPSCMQAVQL